MAHLDAYFHQDFVVARKIFERNPRLHIDVGSRVDGFVAHVATFSSYRTLPPLFALVVTQLRVYTPLGILVWADMETR